MVSGEEDVGGKVEQTAALILVFETTKNYLPIMSELELLYYLPLSAVIICWFLFAAAFFFMKKPPKAKDQKRDNKAIIGIILEGIAYAIIWMFRRDTAYLVSVPGVTFDIIIAAFTILLAIASVWLILAALKTLGKQWSVAARVIEGHQLITNGPYRLVRNPIYSGMFGMLIATGLVYSRWDALLIAMAVFWYGTAIRVKAEEKLLRESFGASFDEYARRVPPMIPNFF